MGFLMKRKKRIDEIVDATGQYIEQGSPISNVSMRNLPSPSEVKGQSHLLLMPFYQEIMEEEAKNKDKTPEAGNSNKGPQTKKKKKMKHDSDGNASSESSEETGIDFNVDFQH